MDDVSKRQQHPDDDAVDRPEHQHAEKRADEDIELLPVGAKEPVCDVKLRRAHERGDDDRREHRDGEVLDEPRAQQQHARHDRRRDERDGLCPPAVLLVHRRARDAPVHRAAADKACGKVAE